MLETQILGVSLFSNMMCKIFDDSGDRNEAVRYRLDNSVKDFKQHLKLCNKKYIKVVIITVNHV